MERPVHTSDDAERRPRRPGRPRSDQARKAILDAAAALLVEQGLDQMAVDEVAARARVSKATIYRWWGSKAELALDAFTAQMRPRLAVPDRGNLQTDLRSACRALTRHYGRPPLGPVLSQLVGEAQRDPALATELHQRITAPLRQVLLQVPERAIARGELPPDSPSNLLIDLMAGAVYYNVLTGTVALSRRYADSMADLLLRGFDARRP